jgi:bleomycin hydrolase
MDKHLDYQSIACFAQEFEASPKNLLALNAVTQSGAEGVAVNRPAIMRTQHAYSHQIETPKVTDQKNSGRCWLFAGLNTMRLSAMKKMNLEKFELSQNYLMFWDKLEKANFFLENMIETCAEPLEGRLVAWLLQDPLPDGGQWDMFANLIKKYGVVPKFAMPETHSSSKSASMNQMLIAALRADARILRQMAEQGATPAEMRQEKTGMLNTFYRMLSIHLGQPPASFLWEWRDKDKVFHRHPDDGGHITPLEFYEQYVAFDLDDQVCLINAPTQDKPYQKTYTVQYLGNVVGGREVRYLNVDMTTLKNAAIEMIRAQKAVWFGCDVGKMMQRDLGILDTEIYALELLYDTPIRLDKAARLDYGHSRMTHAMVLTGVDLDVSGNPIRWRVENSWGEALGDEGYMTMTDRWFEEYLYEVMVSRQFLSPEILAILDTAPVVLPPWDPMGALAKAGVS